VDWQRAYAERARPAWETTSPSNHSNAAAVIIAIIRREMKKLGVELCAQRVLLRVPMVATRYAIGEMAVYSGPRARV